MSNDPSKIQDEGDDISAKKFRDTERGSVEGGRVYKVARETKDGPEGAELEAARRASAQGHILDGTTARHAEHKLDKALADSFPASDPMPASPGSD